MALSVEQKNQLATFIATYRGWIAFAIGFITGVIVGYFTDMWQLLFLSAILAGLFATSNRRGILYGTTSTVVVYAFFLLIDIFTSHALQVLSIFVGIIGIAGTAGAIVGVLLILVIAYVIGLTGGYLGAVIHSFITWPSWE